MQTDCYVIVQAGGRGSRLRHHTWNKPKCLVSVQGKPILYHLFDRFPQASFLVIGDYLFDQLGAYLALNAPTHPVTLIKAIGTGTCAGINDALKLIPEHANVTLVWSDLHIAVTPTWPNSELPILCATSAFACRWSLDDNDNLQERVSDHRGIPGLFHFPKRSAIPPVPESGEFVRWWSQSIEKFLPLQINDIEELGDFSTIEKMNERDGFSRFFNDVQIGESTVVKTVIDPNFNALQDNELNWYKTAQGLGFKRIPKIIASHPLTLERIKGTHAFQMDDLTQRERRAVMMNYIDTLESLHALDQQPTDPDAIRAVYIDKSKQRVESVSRVIPGIDSKSVTVNGRKCKNPFAESSSDFWKSIEMELQSKVFTPIHGDPTFSNSLIDRNLRVWLIDPRGYFKNPGIYGDPRYDFSKVYYSAIGNYDAFNRRKFKLHVDGPTVEVLMEENPFSLAAQEIFSEHFSNDLQRIQLIHGLIWLSLTGYVRDDIDSIIGAFYLGLYWLEEGISR